MNNNSKDKRDDKSVIKSNDSLPNILNSDSVPIDEPKLDCNCYPLKEPLPHDARDLRFSKYFGGTRGNNLIDSLIKWRDADYKSIRSIRLDGFDTIPKEMGIFENLETIDYRNALQNMTIEGMNLFPKLKNLILWGTFIKVSSNDEWLKRIEFIHAEKSRISGLESFKWLSSLKKLKFSFSGFDNFPKDFESMKCLRYFQTGADMGGKKNLNEISLNLLPCLQYVEFHSWDDNFSNLPRRMDRIDVVKVHHSNLTTSQKDSLKLMSRSRTK